MKTKTLIKLIIFTLFMFIFFGCEDPGVTSKELTGYEEQLPFELRGLKVYAVSTGGGGWIKVAVFQDQVNSLTYSVGKSTATTIIVNPNTRKERVIHASQIISENDSIIVLKK